MSNFKILDAFQAGDCYEDNESRVLPFSVPNNAENDVHVCVGACQSSGYAFAGMQYGYECYCGNSLPDRSLHRPSSDCNMPCSGDDSQMCGGYWRINIYPVGM